MVNANRKRLMGIDFGEVRIGIALSDPMQIISSAFETIRSKARVLDLEYIANLIRDKEVCTVVIGLPINMDGTESDRAVKTREFGEQLSKLTPANIVFQDERLSSIEAEEILLEANVRREDRKNLIDKLAAQIILQSYMDGNK